MTTVIAERTVATNGIELFTAEAGEGPLVVLCHGFPELGYSWRHQIPALANAGYHVIAPDMRGYGRSTRPDAIGDYDVEHVAGDLLGLLDDVGEDTAVFVGHDWGAQIVWNMAILVPERMDAVVGMSVPFTPYTPIPPTQMMRERFGDGFYILQFQPPGVVDAVMNANPDMMIRTMLGAAAAAGLGELSPADIDRYATEFARTGFTGGINYYRNFDRNWELLAPYKDRRVEMPAAFITGSNDVVRSFAPGDDLHEWVLDLRANVVVEGANHGIQQERPAEVNEFLLDFLAGLDLNGR